MRSFLFVPADSKRKFERARTSEADALIIDLEDSVARPRLPEARRLAGDFLRRERRADQSLFVRINPLATGLALDDLVAVMPARPDGIVLPKSTPEDVVALDHYLAALETAARTTLGATQIFVIATETPAAMFRLGDYAGCSSRLTAMSWGAEDLAGVLGAINRRPDGSYDDAYRLARSLCVLGAAAAGASAIDTTFTDYRNGAGLEADCAVARRAGFTGKIAIHPDQVPIINAGFSVSAEELAWAQQVVDAFAANPDAGTIGIEGKMIDRPHLVLAERILARAAGQKF